MLFTTTIIYHSVKLLIAFASYSFHLWSLLDCGFLLSLSWEHCFSGQAGEQDHVIFGVRDLWEIESISSSSSYLEECNRSFDLSPLLFYTAIFIGSKVAGHLLTSSFMVRWGQITYDADKYLEFQEWFQVLSLHLVWFHENSKYDVQKDGGYHYAAKPQ